MPPVEKGERMDDTIKDVYSKAKLAVLRYINPSLTKPTSGRIIITSNCPLRCQMCTFWRKQHEDPSLNQIKFWIKEMADFGIEKIAIGGGEPFIRKDLAEIVNEIKSYGIRCTITTSGYLIDKVPFPPVDEIVVSVDGATPKTHDAIRGVKGSWENAIKTIQVAKKKCMVKQVNFVLQKDNYHELMDFIQLANEMDVPVALIPVSLKLAAQTPLSKSLVELDLKDLRKLIGKAMNTGRVLNTQPFIDLCFEKLEKGTVRQKCMAPYHCILIYSNGDVYPCGNLDLTVGTLSYDQHLKDLYATYGSIRWRIWSGLHPFCNQCIYPDIMNRSTLRWGIKMFVRRLLSRGSG